MSFSIADGIVESISEVENPWRCLKLIVTILLPGITTVLMKITRALISVSDKTGIAAFARALERQGVDIISTGGTAELAAEGKDPGARDFELHGISRGAGRARENVAPTRARRLALQTWQSRNMRPKRANVGSSRSIWWWSIFIHSKRPIAKPDVTLAEAIENIDIGGPSMIRSAAKNYEIGHRGGRSGRLRCACSKRCAITMARRR